MIIFGIFQKAISLPRQIEYYKDWQNNVISMVGKERANGIFSSGIHILSAGSSDFLQNYYINPALQKFFKPSKIADILMKSYYAFIEVTYKQTLKHHQMIKQWQVVLYVEYLQFRSKKDRGNNIATNRMFAGSHHAIWSQEQQVYT